jgi:DNA-binding transcriptional MerR regulator
MKSYSTEKAAKLIGVTRVTLQRWLRRGLIRPSIAIPMSGRTFWNWTTADIRRAKELRGTFKTGPKPKRR